MPTLEWTTRREDGVTLVSCRLSNDREESCRVRLCPEPDTVAPPRARGLPAPGWRDGRYETVLRAGTTVGVGFATPARPPDPPATLTVLGEAAATADGALPEPTATGAVRSLLDPRPPRAAVSAGVAPSCDADQDVPTDGPVGGVALAQGDRVATVRRRIDAREP